LQNRIWIVCSAVVFWGCNGVISGADDIGGAGSSEPRCGRSVCGATGELAAATAFPRLTHAQWENSVRDLLRLDAGPGLSGSFEPDTRVSYFDNNARALRVSGDLWGDYQAAAESLADAVTADTAALARLLPSDLPADLAERARALVRDLGRRAYRRPLSNEEVDAHVALFEQGAVHYPDMDAFDGGVRVLLEAFLQSPHFVYRVELGQAQNGDAVQLSDFEIASRLSYMIWNTMPDDELLDEAEGGRLRTAEQIATQAVRLLDDPRGQPMLERFHAQLFDWDLYRNLSKDPSEFPLYYAGVGEDMYEEARRFVEQVVLAENGNLAELLTAPYTFVNADLAAIYGLEDGFDQSFSRASFASTEHPERGGLLTQLGFLASHGGLTGSIHRGVFINHRILCTNLPPPPDIIPPIPADSGTVMTSRERIEMHTGPGTCGASCHGTFINPVGFAFERFDGLGQYRTEEIGMLVDASATFEFVDGPVAYDGAAEFTDAITARVQTHDCYTKHWVEYALGRDTAGSDLDLIQDLGDASLEGRSIKELIIELVQSEAFRARNLEGS
jgi:Protein of unknown function (DUF1592)/Protein of unknown function (DUF1588)/Protein of unknown function (DUF1595)/Protein of unknown function (DUF1587)/Protein of unknown function (DUF1585)